MTTKLRIKTENRKLFFYFIYTDTADILIDDCRLSIGMLLFLRYVTAI